MVPADFDNLDLQEKKIPLFELTSYVWIYT